MLLFTTAALALSAGRERGHPTALGRSRVLDQLQPLQLNARPSPTPLGCLRGGASAAAKQCDVILIGCGVPKRGMGWYHAKQMLDGDVPSAQLTTIVEPWFLGQGADSPPGKVGQPPRQAALPLRLLLILVNLSLIHI